jgi:uncharacterized protein (TIGR00297 family)
MRGGSAGGRGEAACQANGLWKGVQDEGATERRPPRFDISGCLPAVRDARHIVHFAKTAELELIAVLSRSGGAAAVVIGTAALAAGWAWVLLLVLFFVSSVALTRFRASTKAARTGRLVAKGGPRDAAQVFANGGVFALGAVLWLVSGWDGWRALSGGALAAATSDTWATEVGMLAAHAPRSIVSGRRVPTGTSGGVSAPGLAAAMAGAAFVALASLAVGWPRAAAAAALAGGIAGSTIDSLLGATLQARRWCDRCGEPTERRRHICGAQTRVAGGIGWLENDAVNVLSTAAGGALGLMLGA